MKLSDVPFHASALSQFFPALFKAGIITHQGGIDGQLKLLPNLARYRFTTARGGR